MIELKDENYKTTRYLGEGHQKQAYWVFRVTENLDLYSYAFDEEADAEAFIESVEEDRCIMLAIEDKGAGRFLAECKNFT